MVLKRRVLFVVPRVVKNEGDHYDLPLGMLYIATVVKRRGNPLLFVDLNESLSDSVDSILGKTIGDFNPDVLMVGGLSAFYCSIEQIITISRQLNPSIMVVLGGGVVSSTPKIVCEALFPDVAVVGEGEEATDDILTVIEEGGDLHSIKGLFIRDEGAYTYTGDREPIKNIDNIPFPDYSLVNLELYFSKQSPINPPYYYIEDFPRTLPIITSRSCPLSCTFCFHPIGKSYRTRSLDNVFEEIDNLVTKYGVTIISVMDEMMSANRERLIEFANRIEKYNIKWVTQLWTSSVDDETLKAMKRSGCYLISYGLESISDKVLKSMKKHSTNKLNIERALELTVKNRITIQGNFIFGDPAETTETYSETLDWWSKHKEYQINLGRIAPYPGTALYELSLKNGLISDEIKFLREGTPSLNMTQMSKVEYGDMMRSIGKSLVDGRKYCKLVSITSDSRTDYESYLCDIECPYCNNINRYGNMRVSKPSIIKIGCRSCGLRFDLNPSQFPNLVDELSSQRRAILALQDRYGGILVTPAVLENVLVEYFDLLDISFDMVNIVGVLDSNSSREGELFLDMYPVYPRSASAGRDLLNFGVVVMPSIYKVDIVNELLIVGFKSTNVFVL